MSHLIGIVVSNEKKGFARVITHRSGACSGCRKDTGGCSGCLASSKYISMVEDLIGTEPGDMVRVELNSFDVVKGAALLYLFPVLSLMTCVFVGSSLSSFTRLAEGSGVFGGAILGLLIAVWAIKRVDGSRWARRKLNPKITAILKSSPGGGFSVEHSAVSCCS